MTHLAEPCPARNDTQAQRALWDRYDEAARHVAITSGYYIEAMDAADEAHIDIYWRLLAKRSAEFQAVRAALGLTDPEGA